MTKNILLVGVGGQGTILAGKILTLGLQAEGYDVKMSEIHGMSQRGGSVTSHIKFSKEKVYSPVIEKGEANVIVAFEKMEALRYLEYLKEGGELFVNDFEIPPIPVTSGAAEYPQNIIEELKSKAKVTAFDAGAEAEKIGSGKVMNMILLGTIIGSMNLEHIDWGKILEENVKPQFIDLNKAAIARGIELAKQ